MRSQDLSGRIVREKKKDKTLLRNPNVKNNYLTSPRANKKEEIFVDF